ncbi:MAG: hypothetical protein QFC55_00565 [Chloroflexota bacterium]|nr:hypothetical protein [Chloroflexota bacterium]
MRPISIFLAALFAVACGSTAQVVTTPTPAPTDLQTPGPTSDLTAAPSSTPLGSQTPIPLGTPTPINLSTPTPPGSSATPTLPIGPTDSPGNAPFGPFVKLDSFPAADAFEVTDVNVTPSGLIAVGFGGLNGADYYGVRQGIVWTSVDGMNWLESVDPSLVNVTPIRVVSKGSDLYLAGTLSACSELDDNCTDVAQAGNGIWRSTNGGAWELLPQVADMQSGYIDDMLLAGDKLVVYGGAGGGQETTVWVSQDGATWTSTTDLSGMDPITSMAVGPAGLNAFGNIYDDALLDVVLIATTSTDGATFSPATTPDMTGSGIDDLAAGPNGMVGVGYHTSELFDIDGVAVRSSDGLAWTQATNNDGSFAGSALQAVHALVGGGYVAVGYTPRNDDFSLEDGTAWFSPDGSNWQLIARLDGGFSALSTSALAPAGVVVFAAEQTNVDEDTVGSVIHAWFAPLASLHG